MDDTIQVSDELKQIASTIGEAAELLGNASKLYEQTFKSFIEIYLGKTNNDEVVLADNFIKDLDTLYYFYGQAKYYVDYCLENLSTQDKEEADSYNANMV